MQCKVRKSTYTRVLNFAKVSLCIATVSTILTTFCSRKGSNEGKYAGVIVTSEETSVTTEIPEQSSDTTVTSDESSIQISTKQIFHHYPTRLTQSHDGKIYVSDVISGSVAIYNKNLKLIGEIKNLDHPLGVAVDQEGKIYVGNNGRDNIEVYSANFIKINTIDNGAIKMPNDLALDQESNLYVADSLANTIKVYNSTGKWLKNIGEPGDRVGELLFPASVIIAYRLGEGELYVADQGNTRVQVFNLQGQFLRTYGSAVEAFSSKWEGRFVRLQSLAMDKYGRLHAADCYMNNVQILDADSGQHLDSYGSFGSNSGELNMPLDIFITQSGQVLTANSGNKRIEVIYTIQ